MKILLIISIILISIVTFTGCKKEDKTTTSTTNSTAVTTLGSTYEGGIVFYIDGTGKHGLVAAPADQSSGLQWYNGIFVNTNATGTAIGTGQSNTTAIVTVQGAGSYAAKLCDNLVLGGKSDWFLPSKDELNQMYLNLQVKGLGSFANNFYWSSSESNTNYAWGQDFHGGGQAYIGGKDGTNYVRAVRTF